MIDKPLVSILMTAYNRQEFIAEAIESVLKSTYQNWELIIVDDGSKDETVAIAKSYEAKDPRIKVYINDKNLGDYPNRNKAASLATGEWIQYLDSDDTIFEDSLEKLLNLTQQYPNVGIFMRSKKKEVYFITSKDALQRHFFEEQFLYYGPGGLFINKSFFDKINQFPEKYGPANDMYFNLKAATLSDVVTHPYRTIFYRIHDGQESNKKLEYIIQNYRYMRDALNELALPFPEEKIRWLQKKNNRRFIVNLFQFGKKDKNPGNLFKAWKQAGFSFSHFMTGIFH